MAGKMTPRARLAAIVGLTVLSWLAVGAVVGAAVFGARAAFGHGDAAWIQNNPSYKRYDQPSVHCCGPQHCGVAPPGKFVEVAGGVMDAETQRVYTRSNGTGVYVSKDENWWWCWSNNWPTGKVPVCVFKPHGGV